MIGGRARRAVWLLGLGLGGGSQVSSAASLQEAPIASEAVAAREVVTAREVVGARDAVTVPVPPSVPVQSAPRPEIRPFGVLERGPRFPVYDASAALRLAVLVGGGARVMAPVGFGVAFRLRAHFVPLGPLRFGFEGQLGHTHFFERRIVPSPGGDDTRLRRYASLSHTDLTVGPSLQFPSRRIFVQAAGGVGVAVNQFLRPVSAVFGQDEAVSDVSLVLRGAAELGIPIGGNQGLSIGQDVHVYLSRAQVALSDGPAASASDPPAKVSPFDVVLSTSLAYQFWF